MVADRFSELMALVGQHWGFQKLRPLQEQAMRAVLQRRDSLVVMPTGGGKSLCFQAPALLSPNEPTVVVSPLIALMKDQVDSLRAAGVSARHIDSSLTDAERLQTFNELRAKQVRLLFISPERLAMPNFQEFLQQLGVNTFAIDEAHCISHWGHDFRPEYRQLRTLRNLFPNATVHGYTATATEQVRADIVAQLGLRNPELLVGNFDRPNLCYRVWPRLSMLEQVIEVLKRHAGEAGIIYCIRRRDVDSLTADLKALGYNAAPYHAGMSTEDRKATQEAFRAERCDLVVATVAFGMGIDRSNVRFVLHAGMPKSIEHYQQEAGRAGRDGLAAECILLANGSDIMTWKYILEKSATEKPVDADFLPNALAHLDEISDYCEGAQCRHRVLVEHFGQKWQAASCEACDICLGEIDIEPQSQEIARKILSCVARVQERFGVKHVVGVLRGEQTDKIVRYGHDNLSTFGLLSERTQAQLRDWIYQLIGMDALVQTEDEFPILRLNARSWEIMRNERQVQLRLSEKRSRTRKTRMEVESTADVDREISEEIRLWRRQIAEDKNLPPYTIFSDQTLRDLARVRPTSLESLRRVHGIGDAKLKAFGQELLDIIVPACRVRGLTVDQFDSAPDLPAATRELPASAIAYFPHFERQRSIDEVIELSGRARSTVLKYLCAYIETQRPASIDPWVPPDTRERILAAAKVHGSQFLRPIFEALNGEVNYDMIRIALSFAGRDRGSKPADEIADAIR